MIGIGLPFDTEDMGSGVLVLSTLHTIFIERTKERKKKGAAAGYHGSGGQAKQLDGLMVAVGMGGWVAKHITLLACADGFLDAFWPLPWYSSLFILYEFLTAWFSKQ